MGKILYALLTQQDMSHDLTRYGPTLFVMEIALSLGSPDSEYSRKQNDSDLRAAMRPHSGRAQVTPKPLCIWRTRNWAKRIIASIQLCQEKKTYSHKQCHTSTQRQKSSEPSQECDNTINSQSHQRSKIAGKIIIKEGRTRKVSQKTLSFKQRKRRERGES